MPGLLDIFSNNDPYGDMLTEQQRQGLANQAMLNAGLAILMNSTGQPGGPRPGLGQALGAGFMAGQQGYQHGAEGLVQAQFMRQKLDEARRQAAIDELIRNEFTGGGTAVPGPTPSLAAPNTGILKGEPWANPTDPTAPPLPGPAAPAPGQGAAPPVSGNAAKAAVYRRVAEKIGPFKPELAKQYLEIADRIDPTPEWGAPQEAMVDGQRVLVQYDKRGNYRLVEGVNPSVPLPSEVGAVEYITGQPLAGTGQAGMEKVGGYNKAKAVSVNINKDESFAHEGDLRKELQGLPISKAYNEVQQSWDQINTALNNPSPANDLVAATKFMKLLDPGSVVRESELGMAMAATGLEDKMRNYFSMLKNGTKLTPNQRQDFLRSAQALYNAASQRYNAVADQYRSLAKSYKLDPGRVVPAPNAQPAQPAAREAPPANDPLKIRR